MMSIATTSTTPTACSATTTVSASSPRSSAPSAFGLSPIACACVGSKAYRVRSRRFRSRIAEGHGAESEHLREVGDAHAEEVAEQDVAQVGLAGNDRDEHEAEREERGEDDADRGVLLDPARRSDDADEGDRPEAEHERTEREGRAQEVGEHHARQHGVRDRVAHQRPSDEHEPAAQDSAHDGGRHRHEECPLHEVVAQRLEQEVEERHGQSSFRRRRASGQVESERPRELLGLQRLIGRCRAAARGAAAGSPRRRAAAAPRGRATTRARCRRRRRVRAAAR